MITLLAIVLWIVLARHRRAACRLGSRLALAAARAKRVLVRTAGGTPGATRMYPPASCFVVAALLAGVSVWPLFAVGLLPEAWPRWLTLLAGAGIAAVFLGRGMAGYIPAWRRLQSAEPFATLDRRYYSPLCLALGAGFLIILIREA